MLTSYGTYERLRDGTDDNGARVPEEVEALVAKLAVSIVSPSGNPARGAEQRMPVGGSRESTKPTTVWWMIRAVVSTRSARVIPIGSRSRWNAAMRSMSATSAAAAAADDIDAAITPSTRPRSIWAGTPR